MKRKPPIPGWVHEIYELREVGAVALVRSIQGDTISVTPMTLGAENATSEDLVLPRGTIPGGDWTLHVSLTMNVDRGLIKKALWDIGEKVEGPLLFASSGGREGALGLCSQGSAARNIGGEAYRLQLEILESLDLSAVE